MANISEDLATEDLNSIKFLLSRILPREKLEKSKVSEHWCVGVVTGVIKVPLYCQESGLTRPFTRRGQPISHLHTETCRIRTKNTISYPITFVFSSN